MTTNSPGIVVVGAGAMGVMAGYHLALAGAQTVYLVRLARATKMPAELLLYSYDDQQTHAFTGFGVITDAAEIAAHQPEFVLVTLDGASLSSDEGMALLARIGDVLRASRATLIIGSVGIGLRDLAVAASGLPGDRVIGGMIALVGHKVAGVDLPIHPPTDPARLAQSDFAFRHLNETGFVVEGRNAGAAARFAAIFNRSGIATCRIAPRDEFGLLSRGIMPIFAACEILNWPKREALFESELWPVAVEAVRAIQGLAAHGEPGKAAASALTAESLAVMWAYLETAALPLDWQAFNAYQHGAKVRQADILLLETCVEQGERERRDMAAVKVLLGGLRDRS